MLKNSLKLSEKEKNPCLMLFNKLQQFFDNIIIGEQAIDNSEKIDVY